MDREALRDFFAAHAMQAVVSLGHTDFNYIAGKSYDFASAMLEERDKRHAEREAEEREKRARRTGSA